MECATQPDQATGNEQGASTAPPPLLLILLSALLLISVGLIFYNLGERDLWSSHEARAAMDAQSLLQPGSNGVPRLHDGRLEMQKPPLYYWLVAAIGWLRGGVDEQAVRLPAALSAVGVLLVVTLGLGVWLQRPLAGLFAALILVTGIHFPWLARIGRIDGPLAFTVTVAAMVFLGSLSRGDSQRWVLMLGYVACGIGVLLKGPIGLVLPLAIVLTYVLIERRWSAWRELRLPSGLFVVLLLVVPVFLWLEHVSAGQFSREFLWHHNVERGLGGSRLRSHPVWLYLPYLLLYLLPWSVLLVPAGWNVRRDDLARAGLAWLLGVVVLLSLARFKRADYLLPAYPGAAIFLGCWLERLWQSSRRRTVERGFVGIAALMLIGWGARIVIFLPKEESYRDYRPFAALIRQRAPKDSVIFFRTEAHTLAFRVGQPLEQLVEWQRLQRRLAAAGTHWLVTPPPVAAELPEHLLDVEIVEVQRITDLSGGNHERPLVLLQATSRTPRADPTPATAHQRSADQPRTAATR